MARIGVTYLEVAKAADELIARGTDPSIRLVRAALGETGSPNTIQRHLSAWREARPAAAAAVAELSPSTTLAIATEIAQAAARARAEVEGQLLQARSEAEELASVGEQLELEREELQARLVELTTERDQRIAVNQLQSLEITELQNAIERENAAAEAARTQVAKAEIKLEMAVADKAEILRLREDLREQGERLVHANRDLAVSRAEVDAAAAAYKVVLQQIEGLQGQLAVLGEQKSKDTHQLQAEVKELRSELAKVGGELSQARVSEASATGRLQAMAEAAAKAEKVAEAAQAQGNR